MSCNQCYDHCNFCSACNREAVLSLPIINNVLQIDFTHKEISKQLNERLQLLLSIKNAAINSINYDEQLIKRCSQEIRIILKLIIANHTSSKSVIINS